MVELSIVLPYYAPDLRDQIYWVGQVNGMTCRYPLIPDEGRVSWSLSVALEEGSVELTYSYQVEREGSLYRVEPPHSPHTLRLEVAEGKGAIIYDYWIEADPEHRYSDSPLAPLLGRVNMGQRRMPSFSTSSPEAFLIPIAKAYEGELLLVGSDPSIGAWQVEHGISLTLSRHGYLMQFPKAWPTEYKLVLRERSGRALWEEGANRHYQPTEEGRFVLHTLTPPHFEGLTEAPPPTLTGTAVPLFSLRGKHTMGIGDFGAALELLDWMEAEGQSVLQLLPIYDTTFTRTEADSYPYSAVTTYGLHPNYLDLPRLPGYAEAPERAEWEARGRALEALSQIDYMGVTQLKEEVVLTLYKQWRKGREKADFTTFVAKEGGQLLSYALFTAIRDLYPDRQVKDYPPYKEVLAEWQATQSYDGHSLTQAVERCQYVQYYLYQQLEELQNKAHHRGILLKGDLPIGVSRNSVDVWVAPHLFCLDKEAGSPPDAFSKEGQDWAFPTYNWEAMATEGYAWWHRRLSRMSRQFDALRIDHILGFFRIWSIPAGSGDASAGWYVPAVGYRAEEVAGLEPFFNQDEVGQYHPLLEPSARDGYDILSPEPKARLADLVHRYYYHDNDQLWRATALQRLTHIMSASEMLLCAEDLGVLPQSIQEVLSGLDILSLEVLRMPKKIGRHFVEPQDIPRLSVLTTSTHDMPSLRGWWQTLVEEERQELAHLYHMEEVSPRGLVQALLRDHHSILLILPLQDWFVLTGFGSDVPPEAEQINKPQDPHHIWNYRLPLI